MSEQLSDLSNAGSSEPSGDFSVGSNDIPSEAPSDLANADLGPSLADTNFDDLFGLSPELKETKVAEDIPTKTDPDVQKVADPPAPRQSVEVETKGDAKGEEPDADATTKTQNEGREFNERLDWQSAPAQFRSEFEALKNDFLKLAKESPATTFVSNPVEFTEWMKETSPTAYTEIGGMLATESAQQYPKEWIEYFAQNNPDELAQIVSGRDGMTLDRLQAELSYILDDDNEEILAVQERQKAALESSADAKAVETPEQREIREWREEREAQKRAAVVGEVFQPIESAVDNLVSEAGLEISLADYKTKDFAKLEPEVQFKVAVNELLPMWIGLRAKQNPELVAMQERLNQFIERGDTQSAKALQHPLKIAATNFAGEFLSVLTHFRANAQKSATEVPAKGAPNPVVKAAGAGADLSRDVLSESIDWSGTL